MAKEINYTTVPAPAGHRVVVKVDVVEEQSKGGIIKYATNDAIDREQEACISGQLVRIGPNAWKAYDDGIPWAAIGDKITFAKFAGVSLKINGEMYRIMNDEDVTGIFPT